MIKTKNLIINDKEYVKTYSDTGMMLARNGRCYSVAIEPVNFVKKYTETDKPIPVAKSPKSTGLGPTYREAIPMKPAEEEGSEETKADKDSAPTEPVEQIEPAESMTNDESTHDNN